MKLILCAGPTRRSGWQTLDSSPVHGPDICATIPPLPPVVKLIKWDAIELVHGITSFYPWEAQQLLGEIRNVLEPDGVLILEQPDVDIVAASLIGSSAKVRWMFGDPSYKDPAFMNKWGYTPASLTAALNEAGFTRIEVKPAQYHLPSRDFRIEARP